LIFSVTGLAARQSATAAAKMAMSAGSAALTACSISSAVSTRISVAPTGGASDTGPETSVTRAPTDNAAAAMA
jgi:hypothetical protein